MATFSNGVMTITGAIQLKRGTTSALTASDYVPAAGELIGAIDTGMLKMGDGVHIWSELPAYDGTLIANNYSETVEGKALDAVKGNDLNTRVAVLEGITGIDGGEINIPKPTPTTDYVPGHDY